MFDFKINKIAAIFLCIASTYAEIPMQIEGLNDFIIKKQLAQGIEEDKILKKGGRGALKKSHIPGSVSSIFGDLLFHSKTHTIFTFFMLFLMGLSLREPFKPRIQHPKASGQSAQLAEASLRGQLGYFCDFSSSPMQAILSFITTATAGEDIKNVQIAGIEAGWLFGLQEFYLYTLPGNEQITPLINDMLKKQLHVYDQYDSGLIVQALFDSYAYSKNLIKHFISFIRNICVIMMAARYSWDNYKGGEMLLGLLLLSSLPIIRAIVKRKEKQHKRVAYAASNVKNPRLMLQNTLKNMQIVRGEACEDAEAERVKRHLGGGSGIIGFFSETTLTVGMLSMVAVGILLLSVLYHAYFGRFFSMGPVFPSMQAYDMSAKNCLSNLGDVAYDAGSYAWNNALLPMGKLVANLVMLPVLLIMQLLTSLSHPCQSMGNFGSSIGNLISSGGEIFDKVWQHDKAQAPFLNAQNENMYKSLQKSAKSHAHLGIFLIGQLIPMVQAVFLMLDAIKKAKGDVAVLEKARKILYETPSYEESSTPFSLKKCIQNCKISIKEYRYEEKEVVKQ